MLHITSWLTVLTLPVLIDSNGHCLAMQDTMAPVLSFQQTPQQESAQPTAELAFSADDSTSVSYQCLLEARAHVQALARQRNNAHQACIHA